MHHACVVSPYATVRQLDGPTHLALLLVAAAITILGLATGAQASFVAAGDGVRDSADGLAWNGRLMDPLAPMAFMPDQQFRGVAYGGGAWVIALDGAYTSVDGWQWDQTLAYPNTGVCPPQVFDLPWLQGVTYGTTTNGPSLFAAVGGLQSVRGYSYGNFVTSPGGPGTIYPSLGPCSTYYNQPTHQVVFTSPDGVAWSPQATPIETYSGVLMAITHGTVGGTPTFVTVGSNGQAATSNDAVNWVGARASPQTLRGVAWGNDQFIAVGEGGTIVSSADGTSWLPRTSGTGATLHAVTYGNGLWVAVGSGMILTSTDGITWTSLQAQAGNLLWRGVTYGNGRFVAVSLHAPQNATSSSFGILTSTDGVTWAARSGPIAQGLVAVTYGGGQFVAVGFRSIMRSADGLDWVYDHQSPLGTQHAVAYDGQKYVMVGASGSIATSPDRVNWTARYSSICCRDLLAAGYGAGSWTAVGRSGTILTSPDAITWTLRKATPEFQALDLNAVAFRPGQWVAVGSQGAIRSSADGLVWTAQPSGTADDLLGVAWGNGTWTAVGRSGTILGSADGLNWVHRTTPSTSWSFHDVAYHSMASGAPWVAVGEAGLIATSVDGVAWTDDSSLATPVPLLAIARDTSNWVAIGGSVAGASPNAAPGSWTTTSIAGASMLGLASDRVPALECLPATQVVTVGSKARIGGGGGQWPYSWMMPGAKGDPSGVGVSVTPSYASPGTYSVTLLDAGASSSAECEVVVVTKLPPAPRCDYKVTKSATDPTLYKWEEVDPALGGGGTSINYNPTNSWSFQSYALTPADPPIEFEFCGRTYSTFRLAASGHVCFDNSNAPTGTLVDVWAAPGWCGSTTPFRNPRVQPAVFGVWGFYTPGCPPPLPPCTSYRMDGTAPNRVLLYEVNQVRAWDDRHTFQMKFFEATSCFEVHYKQAQSSGAYPWPMGAGYQDSAGSYVHFLTKPNGNPPWSRVEEAWRACPFNAMDDAYKVNEDVPLTFDVTANDAGAGQTFKVTSWTTPSNGTLSRGTGSGDFSYAPKPDWNGNDTFTYTATGTKGAAAQAKVRIQVAAINDAPSFAADTRTIVLAPSDGPLVLPGWGTQVQPGPATALDEAHQDIKFAIVSNSDPGIFLGPPLLARTVSSTDTDSGPPSSGAFAALRFTPSGRTGASTICFQPIDSGGDQVSMDSSGSQARGEPKGGQECVTIVANSPPVAYFEPHSAAAAPGHLITFDPCPAPAPRCTHDPDGAIVQYLWELGDGSTSDMASPQHTFATPGTYTVRLTVWDNHGLRTSYSRDVSIAWPSGGPVNEEATASRVAPIADAGEDRTVLEANLVQLAGSGGRSGSTFKWTQVSGPAVQLLGAETATPSFTAPRLKGMAPVDLVFSLRVTEGALHSRLSYVVVRVVSDNHPPVADAGDLQEIGSGTVELDASRSHDQDGDTLAYRWEQAPKPGEQIVDLKDAQTTSPTFMAPSRPGLLHFRLTVSDGKSTTEDHVVIEVQPGLAAARGEAPQQRSSPGAGPAVQATAALDARPLFWGTALFVLLAVLIAIGVARRHRRR